MLAGLWTTRGGGVVSEKGEPRMLYEKQENGTFKLIKVPTWAAERAELYLWFRNKGLEFEEIRFLWEESSGF